MLFALFFALIPAVLYGIVVYFAIRMARKDIPGAWAFAAGCVVGAIGELLAGASLLMAILPGAVRNVHLYIPSFIKTIGFLSAVYGFSQIAKHTLGTTSNTEPET